MDRTIYVKNLSSEVDIFELSQHFTYFGKIWSAAIEYDKDFNSLLQGQIMFQHPENAREALRMNGKSLAGYKLIVHLASDVKPDITKNDTKIFEKSIPQNLDDLLLINFENDDVPTLNEKSKGYEFVEYTPQSNTGSTVKGINEKLIENTCSTLFHYTKIFVKNIPKKWDDADLLNHFSKFGDICDVAVSMTNGKSNGYGFVGYKQNSSAEIAVKEMNEIVLDNNVLQVEPFIPKELRSEPVKKTVVQRNNLYVKNLPKAWDEEEFQEVFEDFGEIVSIKVAKDHKGNSLGFGFVAFQTEEEAQDALEEMHGASVGSSRLEVSFFQKKEDRQKYLQKSKSVSFEDMKYVKQTLKPILKQSERKNLFNTSYKPSTNMRRCKSQIIIMDENIIF